MTYRFSQVDVFSADPCLGNPVAVVLDAGGLDDESLRRFSVWTNLSECTFVLPPTDPGADYRVRIFSMNLELPFAGHPTLGTARAWLEAGGVPATAGTIIQECAAGLVPIRIDGDLLSFSPPPRQRSGPVDPHLVDEILEVLGADPAHVLDTEWLDNGPGWVGVLMDSAQHVLELRPDASRHPGRWDIGVIGAYPHGAAKAFEVRGFFTEGAEPLREDPVTGSLNAAAAEWLISTGRATAPYLAGQGSAMGRNGEIFISEKGDRLWVGGRAEVILSGIANL